MHSFFTDQFAESIWAKKYQGDAADVDSYYRRLAKAVSLDDKASEHSFYQMLINKRFSPGGRILAFGGRPNAKVSLMNCTTHEIQDDSLEAINAAVYAIMRASSRGQGIGIDLSKLRPAGSPVDNAARNSTGSISFMELLNKVGSTIGQDGRRAALLFSIGVDHPDLYNPETGYDFLHVKNIPGKVENANISVRITDDFMRAVQNGDVWEMQFTGKSGEGAFNVVRTVPARDLFMMLASSAHRAAEPGVLYWDTSIQMSNSDLFGDKWKIVGVNACSEQVLDHEGVCNLGSMNLAAYVINPFTKDATFDYGLFANDVMHAVLFLDNVITLEIENGNYISVRQLESLLNLRRVGLGVMGLADMLAMLRMPYGESSLGMVSRVLERMKIAAYSASIRLAKSRGAAVVWDAAEDYRRSIVNSGFYATLPHAMRHEIEKYGTRNVTVLSVAPTGTISNLLGVSSGIEPLFAHSYTRRTRINGHDDLVEIVHPTILRAQKMGIKHAHKLWQTVDEISTNDHLIIHAAAQAQVDASISKTLNFPASATVDDVANAYFRGWEMGLKGMSVYRDGSRDTQVLYKPKPVSQEICPSCGGEVVHKDGCTECMGCGYGKCSI